MCIGDITLPSLKLDDIQDDLSKLKNLSKVSAKYKEVSKSIGHDKMVIEYDHNVEKAE